MSSKTTFYRFIVMFAAMSAPIAFAATAATEPKPAQQAAAKPMSAADKAATRVMIRRDFLQGVTGACGRLYPTRADAYKQKVEKWGEARKSDLDKAMVIMMTRTSREDAAETTALVELEKKALMTWQVDKLGIPMTKKPLVTDCDKIADSIAALP